MSTTRCPSSLAYGHTMSAAGSGPHTPRVTGRAVSSRRWMYVVAAMWMSLAVLAVTQWLLADDSTGRWIAGVQRSLALALTIGYVAQARKTGARAERD